MANLSDLMQKNKGNEYALSGVAATMRGGLPVKYLIGVVLSYLVNAALIAFLLYPIFLKIANGNANLALWIVIPGSAVVQYFRYLIVFTDQLIPNGVQSSRNIVRFVAFAMWLFSCIEVYHATASMEWLADAQFNSLVMFGWGIVTGGWILEISFVKKLNELTDIEVGEGYTADTTVKNRIRQAQNARRATLPNRTQAEQIAEDMRQMNEAPTHDDAMRLLENDNLHKEVTQLKADLEELTRLRQAEASAEGLNIPLEVAALNGHGSH